MHHLPFTQLCHTQSIERVVKIVTEASSKYFSQEKRDMDQGSGEQQEADGQGWVKTGLVQHSNVQEVIFDTLWHYAPQLLINICTFDLALSLWIISLVSYNILKRGKNGQNVQFWSKKLCRLELFYPKKTFIFEFPIKKQVV